ncbi:alcohol dehydrogenase [Lobosporangium transversale]|uniref:Alcohol dehydrogenase n=1 Tax=Lobosporangium transversale TaxID=64571 RepID=A0A1Y2GDL1_9FUNG|nr:alcohol dehydrogenase [Lobosporangium transversale]ORZ04846.1 alcohol dehydrogenase [Lobosporangium transversale]|eukprot:XP_021876783.1 alcohol dehydrogenase [Lobosporangium transversale]
MSSTNLITTAVVVEETGSDEFHNAKIAQLPRPVPKLSQSLVKIKAVSLNHRELWILKGRYPNIVFNQPLGADAVGNVIEVNGETSRFKIGDRVIIMPSEGWISNPRGPEDEHNYAVRGGTKAPGVFTEYYASENADIFKAPAHLTDEEAAALPLAGLTAYRALFTKGQVAKGQNVLVTGIGGGVALFALQFALAAGANVYVTSSDDSKIERAIKLGAKGGVNYRKENWDQELLKLSHGQKFDLTIDSASGPGAVTILSKILAQGGIFVTFGQTAGAFQLDTVPILRNVEIRGSTMGSRVEFEQMLHFVEEHRIRPIVSNALSGLENIPKAIEYLRGGNQFGKVVVRFN